MKLSRIYVLFALTLLFTIPLTLAVEDYQQAVAKTAGVTPDQLSQVQNLPQTSADAKDALLKQSWSDLIEKNIYLAPVNHFFITVSPVFLILFGENYSLSPTLLVIICLWFYILLEVNGFLNGLGMLNKWANLGISTGASILLAQVGAYRGLGTFLFNLVYSPDLWYVRIIMFIAIVLGVFVLHFILKTVHVQLKNSKKVAATNALKDKVETQEEFIKGIKEGTKMDKKFTALIF